MCICSKPLPIVGKVRDKRLDLDTVCSQPSCPICRYEYNDNGDDDAVKSDYE